MYYDESSAGMCDVGAHLTSCHSWSQACVHLMPVGLYSGTRAATRRSTSLSAHSYSGHAPDSEPFADPWPMVLDPCRGVGRSAASPMYLSLAKRKSASVLRCSHYDYCARC